MSDSNERSYYEIALTNAQVLVAFGILLVCVLGAFLSGMWVARTSLEDQLAEEPDRTELASIDEGGDQLAFFDDDTVDDGETAPTGSDPETGSASAATTSRQSTTTTSQPTTTVPAATTTSAVADEPTQASAPPVAGSGVGNLVIQVFSSGDEEQASRLIESLTEDGFTAFMSPVEVDNRTLFRVRVGPFENRNGAEQVAEQLRRRHRLETWITGR